MVIASPPKRLFRVGKPRDAWERKPTIRGMTPPTRYDDPWGIYRTTYASSSAYGAYMEALAALKPSETPGGEPEIDLKKLVTENEPELRGTARAGHIGNWRAKHHIGTGTPDGIFLDLGAPASIAFIREHMQHLFKDAKAAAAFDLANLVKAPQKFTGGLSFAIKQLETTTSSGIDGICYPSRLGHGIVDWAIFEDPDDGLSCITERTSDSIRRDDPEFLKAVADLGLTTDE